MHISRNCGLISPVPENLSYLLVDFSINKRIQKTATICFVHFHRRWKRPKKKKEEKRSIRVPMIAKWSRYCVVWQATAWWLWLHTYKSNFTDSRAAILSFLIKLYGSLLLALRETIPFALLCFHQAYIDDSLTISTSA